LASPGGNGGVVSFQLYVANGQANKLQCPEMILEGSYISFSFATLTIAKNISYLFIYLYILMDSIISFLMHM
jgi:hypothetical protein